MSPYCPSCLGVSQEGEVKCPLDQRFLHRRNCRECGAELFPRELYCADCGVLCREPKEALLVPPEAERWRVVCSGLLDYFTFSMVVFSILVTALGLWVVPSALLASFLYRAAGRSDGRQTFGQAVFHVMTVREDAGPPSFTASLKRGCWELVLIPKSVVDSTALSSLERQTGTMEVSLV